MTFLNDNYNRIVFESAQRPVDDCSQGVALLQLFWIPSPNSVTSKQKSKQDLACNLETLGVEFDSLFWHIFVSTKSPLVIFLQFDKWTGNEISWVTQTYSETFFQHLLMCTLIFGLLKFVRRVHIQNGFPGRNRNGKQYRYWPTYKILLDIKLLMAMTE